MATTAERLGVVETKVENLNEKLDDIKVDVKDMHDCLDRTRDGIMSELKMMNESSCNQHTELAGKISDLEKFKNKGQMYIMLLLAFAAGTGWLGNVNLAGLLKFIGL